MEILNSIGERLREERERLQMTQSDFAEVAEAAGVPGATRQSQARYEKGLAAPSCPYLAALAPVGVDVLYVLTGQRGMQPTPGPALRDGEAELLEGYRALSAREKLGVKALIAGMAPAGSVNVQVSGGTTGHVVTGGHVVIKQTTASTPRRKSTKKV